MIDNEKEKFNTEKSNCNESMNVNTEISIFEHEEFGEIRTIEIDGKIYFVGLDVAKALGYKNPRSALNNKVYKEDKTCVSFWDTQTNQHRTMSVINESGLYSLILTRQIKKNDNSEISEKIKRFQRWVTNEVLPSIRKTGTYLENFVDKQKKLWYNITVVSRKVRKFC